MKKLITSIAFFSVLLFMVAITACTSKEKADPTPNIDSLVEAKVKEALGEAAIDQVIEQKFIDSEEEEDTEVSEEPEDIQDTNEAEDWEDIDLEEMEGKIGPYSITMRLHDLSDVDEGDFVGYYYYNDRPQSKFSLKIVSMVAVNAKGSMHLVMKEFTPSGHHSGTFNGQYECRGSYYAGTFTTIKGKKYDFEVQ